MPRAEIAAILVGGALGALLRYGLTNLTDHLLWGVFPWGTVVVNLLGCLIIGAVWAAYDTGLDAPAARAFLMIGLLGSFTTFSTFGLETMNLWRHGHQLAAMLNVTISNVGGIALAVVGFVLGKQFLPFV